MTAFWRDLKYGVRMLRKNPGFAGAAVLTLSLGIGANTAIFSVVNGVLLKPLPYTDADRLVRFFESNEKFPTFPVAPGNFLDYRAQNRVFDSVAIYMRNDLHLWAAERPERLQGMQVSSGFFSVLGIQPLLGREFSAEDETRGKHFVVMLSYELWQRRFNADPEILGREITLSGVPYTVIGVLPAGTQHVGGDYRTLPHGETVSVWAPMVLGPEEMPRGQHYTNAVARLKPGVTAEQAETNLTAIVQELAQRYQAARGWTVRVVSLHDEILGNTPPLMWILLAAVGMVLLIACVNVANLALARATAREREMTVRAALGAGRGRLVRQMLTESMLLAAAGGLGGLMFAAWGIESLIALSPADLPRMHMVGFDAAAFVFTLSVTALAAILVGLVPALRASRVGLQDSLKSVARGMSGGVRNRRFRNALVVGELGLALVLLIGAGLLLRSFVELVKIDPGFEPEGALTAAVSLPRAQYNNAASALRFYDDLLRRVRALPGVGAAGLGSDLPWTGYDENSGFGIEGRISEPGESFSGRHHMVTDGYFRALGTPLVAGRFLSEQDSRDAPPVVLINESLAKRYFYNMDGSDPIGQRLQLWGELRTIVGTVGDVKDRPADDGAKPAFYFPLTQMPQGSFYVVVRAEASPHVLLGAVQRELHAIDPSLPLADVATLNDIAGSAVATPRFALFLVGCFASVALILAAVGTYGVISYSVAQRTQEVGIRIALGAQGMDILKIIVGRGLVLVLAGTGLGLAGAFAVTRVMQGLLYKVSTIDPTTFAGVALVLAFVALLACYIPARRATRVDPVVALRQE